MPGPHAVPGLYDDAAPRDADRSTSVDACLQRLGRSTAIAMADQLEPALVLQMLPDGAIHLTFGDQTGTVSSHHLVHTKARQLRQAWRRARYLEQHEQQVEQR